MTFLKMKKVIISLSLMAVPTIGLPIPFFEKPMDAFLARYVDKPESVALAFGIPLTGTLAATYYGYRIANEKRKNETERIRVEQATMSKAVL